MFLRDAILSFSLLASSISLALFACSSTSDATATTTSEDAGDDTQAEAATNEDAQSITDGSTRLSVSSVAVGYDHACALLSDGTVWCWGENQNGQLGDETVIASATPVRVKSVAGAVSIGLGAMHTCAVLASGGVKCWGRNTFGKLGGGTASDWETKPVDVAGVTDGVAVAGGLNHTCLLRKSGEVSCWGAGSGGELGDGAGKDSLTPVAVKNISEAVQISVSWEGGCALLKDGTVKCWGRNQEGVIGDGTSGNTRLTPVPVLNVAGATSVSVFTTNACATVSDGHVKCWGANQATQLGNVDAGLQSATPVVVSGIANARSVSIGNAQPCAVLADKTVTCWGLNLGQLTPLSWGSNVRTISVGGYSQMCALTESGTILCGEITDTTPKTINLLP